VCALFHADEITEINSVAELRKDQIRYQDFVEIINWVCSQKDIRIRSIGQLMKENVDLCVDRFINNKYYLRLAHLKPAIWPPNYYIYAQKNTAYDMRMRNLFNNFNVGILQNIAGVTSFYFAILVIFGLLSYIFGILMKKVFNVPYTLSMILKYGVLFLGVVLAVYLLVGGYISYTIIIPLVGLLGSAIGFLMSFQKPKIMHQGAENSQKR
jgi:hypothetical protein